MRFNIDLEDIRYIKILYKDTDGHPCTVKAAIKKFDDKEILACSRVEDKISIKTPQDVTLSIICPDGLYRTKTRLKSIITEDLYIFYVLEPPMGLEYQQNREYFRVQVEYDCVYSLKIDGKIEHYKAKTYDISANGVSIVLPEHLISVEDCYLEILVEGIEIRTKIRYIRSEKTDDGYKLSYTFTQLTNEDRDLISRVCIQKQLEQKRNSAS